MIDKFNLTAEERLVRVRAKIERAAQHISELKAEVRTFLDSNPYEVGTHSNPDTRQLTHYVTKVAPIPLRFSAITGDVIQNHRSALDHLMHQLWYVANPNKPAHDRLQFITESSAKQYKAALEGGVIKGFRQDAIDALHRIEPYDGGKHANLAVLNRLNRIDKHRLLIAVGSANSWLNLGAHIANEFKRMFPDSTQPHIMLHVKPADILFPLEKGDELFIEPLITEPHQKMDFGFSIVIHEPGVIEGKSLLETLQSFSATVTDVVAEIAPCLN